MTTEDNDRMFVAVIFGRRYFVNKPGEYLPASLFIFISDKYTTLFVVCCPFPGDSYFQLFIRPEWNFTE